MFLTRPVSNMAIIRHITEHEKTSPTDLTSIRSSMISDELTGNMASLLEGSVGVQLPTSKINTAAHRQALSKHKGKDISDEGENINASDEEVVMVNTNHVHLLRSTIMDKDTNDIVNDTIKSIDRENRDIIPMSNDGVSSSESSFNGSEGDGILPLLEGFIKRGDMQSTKQFKCLVKGEI
jgi:hypothetical protein